MIMFAGICFFMFIAFNDAYHGAGGLRTVIWESANNTLSGNIQSDFNRLMPRISQGFGIASVLLFAVGIGIFVVQAFDRPREGY